MTKAKTQYVYVVGRQDNIAEDAGRLDITTIKVYSVLETANAAAKELYAAHLPKGADSDETTDDNGCYSGIFDEDGSTAPFAVEVKKYELIVTKKAAAPRAKANPPAKATKRPASDEDEDEVDDEDEETEAAPTKKPAAKKNKTQMPDGKANSLKGLRLLFTGTFDSMDRTTSHETAKRYGAQIVKKLEETDYVVLGVKAGPKKLDEIAASDLDTIDEAEFLEMLHTGVSKDMRQHIERRAKQEAEAKEAAKAEKKKK